MSAPQLQLRRTEVAGALLDVPAEENDAVLFACCTCDTHDVAYGYTHEIHDIDDAYTYTPKIYNRSAHSTRAAHGAKRSPGAIADFVDILPNNLRMAPERTVNDSRGGCEPKAHSDSQFFENCKTKTAVKHGWNQRQVHLAIGVAGGTKPEIGREHLACIFGASHVGDA